MEDKHRKSVAELTMTVARALANTQCPDKEAVIEALVNNLASAIYTNRVFGAKHLDMGYVVGMMQQRLDSIGAEMPT